MLSCICFECFCTYTATQRINCTIAMMRPPKAAVPTWKRQTVPYALNTYLRGGERRDKEGCESIFVYDMMHYIYEVLLYVYVFSVLNSQYLIFFTLLYITYHSVYKLKSHKNILIPTCRTHIRYTSYLFIYLYIKHMTVHTQN